MERYCISPAEFYKTTTFVTFDNGLSYKYNYKKRCDMSNFSCMTFTITKIEQEKSIDGVMRIYFVPNDGVRYGTAFMITLEKAQRWC